MPKHDQWDMLEAAKALYPSHCFAPSMADSAELRFNPLFLDFGEMELQDWAVAASSSALQDTHTHYKTALRKRGGNSGTVTSWNTTGSLLWNSTQDRNPSIAMKNVHGRLRLCTKSIIFEPQDDSRAIIKCPLDKLSSFPTLGDVSEEAGAHHVAKTIVISTRKHFLIKANNIIAPFISVDMPTEFRFLFLHSQPNVFLQLMQNISTWKNKGIVSFDYRIQQPFHPLNLHPHEKGARRNLFCFFMTPLVHTPGCFVITQTCLHFQTWKGQWAASASIRKDSKRVPPKATSWTRSSIVATARRYHGLRDVALEIFFNTGPSILLAFSSLKDREWVLQQVSTKSEFYSKADTSGRPSKVPCHTDPSFIELALHAWLEGDIDNFDYLLLLNSASGRTLHDLSRYPVFPWILNDYVSPQLDCATYFSPFSKRKMDVVPESKRVFRDLQKPIGALNEQRLEYFQTRLKNMQDMDQAFLYGTHYSAPGYVLYFLVRMMPEHMLCLQNGKFDAPDRLFYSLDHCYSSLLSNPADVKECIPQFFDTTANADFLINARNLPLGVTQNGIRVNDVYLPPWAKSPVDFISKNRMALESDYCSRQLNCWIDLIFGVLSRGERAIEAMNLFHPTAYLGPLDLEKMKTEEEKQHAELHATEFGIVPDQLFSKPHPNRHIDLKKEQNIDLQSFIITVSHRTVPREGVEENKESWEVLKTPKPDASHDRRNIKRLFNMPSAQSR